MQRCPRCDGELEKGFILDRDGSSHTRQPRWARGVPDDAPASQLWGRTTAQNIPTETLPVVTWRCKNCGRLEAFAPQAD